MKVPKNSKIWYLCKQHRIANYPFNTNPMFVSFTTHNWEHNSSYITYIYNHTFLLYFQAQFSSFYCSKRKRCNKQISTSIWTKRKLPWLFQLEYNLVLIFDSECILNVWHKEWINYKWHLLCCFDESVLIEILKVCSLWSIQLHQLQCICITLLFLIEIEKIFFFSDIWHPFHNIHSAHCCQVV